MSLRSPLTRLAVAAAAGALLAAASVVPAVALNGPAGAGPSPSGGKGAGTTAGAPAAKPARAAAAPQAAARPQSAGTSAAAKPHTSGTSAAAEPHTSGDDGASYTRGRVTARGGLVLRSRPDQGSQVIGYARQGEIVRIYCRTRGQFVRGNPVWYLLAGGVWAWGSARYIEPLGSAPCWC
ncbi:SH3 domain-containing protein [Streptomyces sp. NPDC046985]|uniref:SH3 domain-containing protein n=1 Tax=Streptomyces sp. NPDC046985 TaxID=3155377 RepID=UPI0033D9F40B